MATTLIGVNDALAVKLWAKRLAFDIVYRTDISALIGESDDSIIQLKSETSKGAGDQVTFALMKKLTQDCLGTKLPGDHVHNFLVHKAVGGEGAF